MFSSMTKEEILNFFKDTYYQVKSFSLNDIIALGAMKALKSFGYKIPGDISIIGFDNMPFGEISSPALTTFDVRKEEIGQVATKLLLEQNAIGENLHRKVEVLTELIERDSVKDLRES